MRLKKELLQACFAFNGSVGSLVAAKWTPATKASRTLIAEHRASQACIYCVV